MKCDKQCSYRTPYGYCSVTKCQTNLGTTYAEPRHFKKEREEMRPMEKNIKSMKTVDTERHGHWKDVQNYYDDVYYECSACGEPWILLDGTPSDNNMNYCPNCGARMDEVEE